MDRLAKKCVIASGIMHGTLVLVLLVGPAFLGSNEPVDPKQIIDFIPFKTLEQSMSGGGNPNVAQAMPAPTPPAPKLAQPEPPQPKPERRPEPEPPKVADKTPKPDPDSLETSNKPKISLKPVVRKPDAKQTAKAAADARAREKAEAKQRTEKFDTVMNNIRTGTAGSVKIDELRGPGGGGIPYAGFNQALISAYMRAWLVPGEAADSSDKVVATITLSRDGNVISARISRASGNAELDKSVQRALDKVPYVAPLPDSVKESQKTFWLEFDPKARRLMG